MKPVKPAHPERMARRAPQVVLVHKATPVQLAIKVQQEQPAPRVSSVHLDFLAPLVRMVQQELEAKTVQWVHKANRVNRDPLDLVVFVVNVDLLVKEAPMANPVMTVLLVSPAHM